MLLARKISEELDLQLGRYSLLESTSRDNIQFILAHPDLLPFLDRWQERNEEARKNLELAYGRVKDAYLEGIPYVDMKFNSGSTAIIISVKGDKKPEGLGDEWTVINNSDDINETRIQLVGKDD